MVTHIHLAEIMGKKTNMTKEEINELVTNMWLMETNGTRKRYKTPQEYVKYAIARMERGWSFRKISIEDHNKSVAEKQEQLKDWKFPNINIYIDWKLI